MPISFTLEITDVARIVCIDERAPMAAGLPMASSMAAEVVMAHTNHLKGLYELIGRAIKNMEEPK